ncbi:alpha/beta hydrolase [Glaciihabitans sp. INWT7]|uniref:alpha/beta fold hydrolase n=1 Tax=Glaciihabitans sp. INWT7 TaxID=2596912 RepID=UPI0016258BF9|nr:alpha/beta hydrolase [Glaciihabitans sp. INWT7]QNE48548.1 alpha/beta hydrolase [Glaciihabitans sp. INWT7]
MGVFEDASRLSVRTDTLNIEYFDLGPRDADAVILLHGFPYDVHSFGEVAPLLVEAGRRVIVPYLRGHGGTVALDDAGRSGQQAAIGADLVEFMTAIDVERAAFAGFDWGARAGCVAAALWPERCTGLVSVSGYLIQDIAASVRPIDPHIEAGLWYFYYFATERGRAGLEENRQEIARVIWTRNSPRWSFTDEELARAARAFDNADYVEVVIHSYRHRLGLAPGHPRYADLELRLSELPSIAVPVITLDGSADGNFPATDGSGYAKHLAGSHIHHVVADAGHNLAQEKPQAFVDAVLELDRMGERPS